MQFTLYKGLYNRDPNHNSDRVSKKIEDTISEF